MSSFAFENTKWAHEGQTFSIFLFSSSDRFHIFLDQDKRTMKEATNIEQVFELIQDGKDLKKTDLWSAAAKFSKARSLLCTLAEEQPKSTEEEKQIASLYQSQAKEYLKESRDSLINAMQNEKENDQQQETIFYSGLTDDEAETRIHTFASLFSKAMVTANEKVEEGSIDNVLSLEERLKALNASLPSGLKTSDERMDDINRGLNRLGLSLYTQKAPFARFEDKDEDEQVEDIIAQAQDEVNFEKNFAATSENTSKVFIDAGEDEDDDYSSEEDEEDAILDDEILAMKTIRKKVVKAQVKLAELVALLDEARSAKEHEETEDDDMDRDEDSSSVGKVDKVPSIEHLATGRRRLIGAKRELKKALDVWKEEL